MFCAGMYRVGKFVVCLVWVCAELVNLLCIFCTGVCFVQVCTKFVNLLCVFCTGMYRVSKFVVIVLYGYAQS